MNQPERVKRFFDQRKCAEEGVWTPPPSMLDPTISSGDADLTPVKSSGTNSEEIIWNPPVPSRRPRRRRWSLDVLSQLFVQPFLWFIFWLTSSAFNNVSRWTWPYKITLTLLMTASVTISLLLIALSVIDYQSSLLDQEDDEHERLDREHRRREGN